VKKTKNPEPRLVSNPSFVVQSTTPTAPSLANLSRLCSKVNKDTDLSVDCHGSDRRGDSQKQSQ
jgi:hypothetical protein